MLFVENRTEVSVSIGPYGSAIEGPCGEGHEDFQLLKKFLGRHVSVAKQKYWIFVGPIHPGSE